MTHITRPPLATHAALAATNTWLAAFGEALERRDGAAAAALFLPDGHWRDLLAFTWSIETRNGAGAIRAALDETLPRTRPAGFHLDADRTPPRQLTRAGREVVEAIFAFETSFGEADAVARLVPDAGGLGGLRAWTVLTALEDLRG
ncbi:MAG: hypothetical protein JOZ58_17610, partial [Acetobacteraceae bacterium]|nr:hypothetical protein [Acetobacteraceae bacterium]